MGRFSMRVKPGRRFRFLFLLFISIIGVGLWITHNNRMREGERLISRDETRELAVVLDE
ncbi:MAG: hypothetical protein ACTJLL_03400 [Anaplasma sp.]